MSSSISSFSLYTGFIVRVAIAFAVLCVTYFGYFAAGSGQLRRENYAESWTAHIIGAKAELSNSRVQPTILLIGGSATYFGFSAEQISNAVQRPALNIGTHAAMGLRYYLGVAERYTRSGDIVIIPVEYSLYRDPNVTEFFAETTYMLGVGDFLALPFSQKLKYLGFLDLPYTYAGIMKRYHGAFDAPTFGYWTLQMTNWGDMPFIAAQSGVEALEKHLATEVKKSISLPDEIPESVVAMIQSSVGRLRAKGAYVVFTQPPSIDVLAPTPEEMDRLLRAMNDAGAEFVVLEANNSLPRDLMYDTRYHPASVGRKISTDRLIAALCQSTFGALPRASLPDDRNNSPAQILKCAA